MPQSLNATFTADFSELQRATASAEVYIQTFEKAALKAAREISNLASSFSGAEIRKEAEIAIRAVESIGGVTKLTENEQKRLIATVQDANDKYRALGQDAPDNLKKITKELEGTTAAQKKVAEETAKAKQAFDQSLQSIGSGLTSVGTTLTAAVSVPIVAGFALSVKAAKDFESAYANVVKTVEGFDVDAFGTLNADAKAFSLEIRNLAKDIPVTASELSRIASIGGQFGVSRENLLDFTRVVAELGVAVDGISAEDAAASLAQFANVAGVGQDQFGRLADVLVELGNKGSSSEAMILEFAQRLAGAGTQAGLSASEIFGLGSTMANLGLNAEAGGTAMSKMLAEMSRAGAQGGQAAAMFAEFAGKVDASVASGQAFAALYRQDAARALQLFFDGLSEAAAGGQNLNLILDELGIDEARLRDTTLRLAGAKGQLADQMRIAGEQFEVGGARSEEARKKFATFDNQLQLLRNQVTDIGIELGGPMITALRNLLDAADPVLKAVAGMAKEFAELPDSAQLTIAAIAGTAGVTPVLIVMAGQTIHATKTILDLAKAFRSLAAADAALGATGAISGVGGAATRVLPFLGKAGLVGAVLALQTASVEAAAGVDNFWNRLLAGITPLGIITRSFKDTVTLFEGLRGAALDLPNLPQPPKLEQVDYKEDFDAYKAMLSDTYAGTYDLKHKLSGDLKAAGQEAMTFAQQYAADMARVGKAGFAKAADDVKLYGRSVKEAAKEAEIAETSLNRFMKEITATTRATKDHNKELKQTEEFYRDMARSVDATTKQLATAERERLKEAMDGAKRSAETIVEATKVKYEAEQNVARLLREQTMSELEFKLDAIDREGQARIAMLDLTSELGRQAASAVRADVDAMMQDIVLRSKEAQQIIGLIQGIPGLGAAAGFLSDYPGVDDALGEMGSGGDSSARRRGRFGQDAAAQWAASWRQQNWNFNGAGNSIQSASNLFANYSGAIDDIIAGDTAVLRATNVQGRGNRAWKGALAGAQEGGQYGGPYGAAGGAIAGLLIGAFRNPGFEDIMRRTGNKLGKEISEELARSIEEIDKSRKDWGREESEIFTVGQQIRDIGIDDGNFDKMAARVRDIFVMVETGKFNVEEATQALDDGFGALAEHVQKSEGLASKSFQELLKLSKQFGIESEAVTGFIKQQSVALGGSLSALAGPLLKEATASLDGQKKALEDVARIEKERGRDSTEYVEALKVANDLQAKHAELAKNSQAEVGRLSVLTLAAFNAAVENNGGDYFSAFEAIGPSFDSLLGLKDALGGAGFGDNAAIAELMNLRDLMTMPENATLVAAVSALGPSLQALTSIGGLTTETLKAMGDQGVTTFDRLVAAGFTENQALRQMRGFLENVIEGHEQLGTPIEENTQRLIDQAREAGILKDDNRDLTEITKDGFKDVKDAILLVAKALGADVPKAVDDAKRALDGIPRNIDTRVQVVYDDPGFTPRGGSVDGGEEPGRAAHGVYGSGRGGGGLTYFAEAGKAELGGPVDFMGDVLSMAMRNNPGLFDRAPVVMPSGPSEIHVHLEANGREFAHAVVPFIPDVLALHGVAR